MYFVFYRTTDVFAAEELLEKNGIVTEVVQTPVQDKAYCGVCVEISSDCVDEAIKLLQGILDYRLIQRGGENDEL